VKKTVGFYQRICQILESRPQEIVHVGDHYEFDYLVLAPWGSALFTWIVPAGEVETL